MAFYNRDEIPAENPLGLNETSISDKDKNAHEGLKQEWEKDKELNGGEPRGFFRRVYDKYLGRDIPHVYETTNQRYEQAKVKGKELEARGDKIAEQKDELENIRAEVAVAVPAAEGVSPTPEAAIPMTTAAETAPAEDSGDASLPKRKFIKLEPLVSESAEAAAIAKAAKAPGTETATAPESTEKNKEESLFGSVKALFDKYRPTKPRYRNLSDLGGAMTVASIKQAREGMDILRQDLALPMEDKKVLEQFEIMADRMHTKELFEKISVLINEDKENSYNVEQLELFETPLGESMDAEQGQKALDALEKLRDSIPTGQYENLDAIDEVENIIRQELGMPTFKTAVRNNVRPFRSTSSESTGAADVEELRKAA